MTFIKKIFLSLIILTLLSCVELFPFLSVYAQEEKDTDERTFFEQVVDALIYPLEKTSEIVSNSYDKFQKRTETENTRDSDRAFDQWEARRENMEKDIKTVGEGGLEDATGVVGTGKKVWDFVVRLFFTNRPSQITNPKKIYFYLNLGYHWEDACTSLLNPQGKKQYQCSFGRCSCKQYYEERDKKTVIECRKKGLSLKQCLDTTSLSNNEKMKDYWFVSLVKIGDFPSPTPTIDRIELPDEEEDSLPVPTELPYINPWDLMNQ